MKSDFMHSSIRQPRRPECRNIGDSRISYSNPFKLLSLAASSFAGRFRISRRQMVKYLSLIIRESPMFLHSGRRGCRIEECIKSEVGPFTVTSSIMKPRAVAQGAMLLPQLTLPRTKACPLTNLRFYSKGKR
jgi:hypothetical protein